MSNLVINPYRFAGGGPPPSGISFVGAASGNDTASLPSHEAGDLILAHSLRINNISSLPAGWTEIDTWKLPSTVGRRIAYRIAVDSATPAGVWANANAVLFLVYRGVSAVGDHAYGSGSSASVSYPGLSLGASSSWVVAFAGHRDAGAGLESPPGALVFRKRHTNLLTGAGFDSDEAVASWGGATVSVGSSNAWVADSVELLAA